MKADKREIVTFVIAALATLVAVWFFLGKMQKSSKTTGISRGYFYLSIHRELSFMHKRETTSSAG